MKRLATAGQELSLELVQQILAEGLVSLAGDEYRMRSIYRRIDVLERGLADSGQSAVWAFMDIIRRAARVNRRDGDGVTFLESFPPGENKIPLPVVQTVWTSGAEEPGAAFVGDIVQARDVVIGDRVYREITRGCMKRQSILVMIYALRTEEARALHIALSHIVQRDKGRLFVAGVKDVTVTEFGREINEEDPHMVMIPGLQLDIELLQSGSDLQGPVTSSVSFDSWFTV